MREQLPDHEIIEVVAKSTMTYAAYKKMILPLQKKGWEVKAFQVGKHSYGTESPIE